MAADLTRAWLNWLKNPHCKVLPVHEICLKLIINLTRLNCRNCILHLSIFFWPQHTKRIIPLSYYKCVLYANINDTEYVNMPLTQQVCWESDTLFLRSRQLPSLPLLFSLLPSKMKRQGQPTSLPDGHPQLESEQWMFLKQMGISPSIFLIASCSLRSPVVVPCWPKQATVFF